MTLANIFRILAAIALPLSIVSCGESKSVELSVAGASLTRDANGRAAIDVSLTAGFARDFAIFTSKVFGRLIEFRLHDEKLTKARLLNPMMGGSFLMSAPLDRADGILSDDTAAEIVRRLSSGDEKLDVRAVE